MSRRAERIAAVIKEEVSRVLEEKVIDLRIGFVTITAVEVSSDLRCATIFVSTYEEKVKNEMICGLRDGSNYIRRKIGKKLHLRYLPKLTFKVDDSIEKGARVEDALKQIETMENAKGIEQKA